MPHWYSQPLTPGQYSWVNQRKSSPISGALTDPKYQNGQSAGTLGANAGIVNRVLSPRRPVVKTPADEFTGNHAAMYL
jgi:hypothetical protein